MGKFMDLVGQRFGRLVVIRKGSYYLRSGVRRFRWECICDCGNIIEVRGDALKSGNTKSCGCLHSEVAIEVGRASFCDLTGKRFGKLIVVRRVDDYVSPQGKHLVVYLCLCDCGKSVSVLSAHLLTKHTQSCGCFYLESRMGENNWNYKGGITSLKKQIGESKEYKQWRIKVFKRDNYTCQYSGKRSGQLHVHHIKPRHIIMEENNITTMEQARNCKELWNVSNGITLSKSNHVDFHMIFGWGTCSLEDFEEWMKGEIC
jgi:5-methylcytosine-specific restriction endonuclease McrA